MSEISSIRSDELGVTNKDKKCAPNLTFENGSCIRLGILVDMVKAYNSENSSNQIKLHNRLETLNPQKYKKYLLKEIKNIVGDKCTTQQCWANQGFIRKMNSKARDELKKYTFRPEGPGGKFEWLNTFNINNVMNQYEKKYDEFKYLGTVPMDFDNLDSLGIKNLNFDNLYNKGKTKLGIVFNLDESWKSGSHWVAMYADLKKNEVNYFDSYGLPPEKRVRSLMRRVANYCENKNNSTCNSNHNKNRHQYENSECGVYSINFILRSLKGESFDHISQSKIPDRKINKCRKKYFA